MVQISDTSSRVGRCSAKWFIAKTLKAGRNGERQNCKEENQRKQGKRRWEWGTYLRWAERTGKKRREREEGVEVVSCGPAV